MSLGVDESAISVEHPVVALVEELARLGVVVVAAAGNNPFARIKPPGAAPSAITVGGYNDHNSTEWIRRELWYYSRGEALNGGHKPEILAPAIWVAAPVLPHTQVRSEAEALFRLAGADDDDLMSLIPRLAAETLIGERLLTVTNPLYARSLVLQRISQEKLITPNYKHVDGTSFAAPIISSIIAQMLEARPGLQPDAIKEMLCRTAEPLAGIPVEVQGHGIVQAGAAMEGVMHLPEEEASGGTVDSTERVPPADRLPS
jgi:serine protease AprX